MRIDYQTIKFLHYNKIKDNLMNKLYNYNPKMSFYYKKKVNQNKILIY